MAFLPELSSAWNVFLLMFTRSFSFHGHFKGYLPQEVFYDPASDQSPLLNFRRIIEC